MPDPDHWNDDAWIELANLATKATNDQSPFLWAPTDDVVAMSDEIARLRSLIDEMIERCDDLERLHSENRRLRQQLAGSPDIIMP